MISSERGTGNERFSLFPQFSLKVGGVSGPRLKSELSRCGTDSSLRADQLLDMFQKPEKQKQVSVVKFSLWDVGIRDYVSGPNGWEKVVKAVQKEGLALCPQLTAPEMAWLNADIIGEDEFVDILSKPITDHNDNRRVFELCRFRGEPRLLCRLANDGWDSDNLVVARLR